MSRAETAARRQGFLARNRKSGGLLLRQEIRRKGAALLRAAMIFGLCFLIIQPILDKISVSFMQERDLYDTTIIVVPRNLTTGNYSLAAMLLNLDKSLLNTALISLVTSLLQVAACALVGYGFARFDFPLKRLWFACVVLVIIIPPQTISSALYLSFRYFDFLGLFRQFTGGTVNLKGSALPYLLLSATGMGLKNGLYIFMIRQYFRSVPQSLEEAAYVDGASAFGTFTKVMLPQAVPILVSCFLFAFVWQWTDVFYTRLFLPTANVMYLSIRLSGLAESLRTYVSTRLGITAPPVGYVMQMISTGVLIVAAPLIALYVFAQRLFIQSISSTGLKE
ncbi:MAG TPA: carbohydrate ABC transporter permease [Candidatus Limnocylindria bacterium]|nr:carbohydrate ABC transporter permease [Candidatus Limnocylindria bacterium]